MERYQRTQLARRARPFLRAPGAVGPIRTRGGFRPSFENGLKGRFYGGIGRGRALNGRSTIGELPQQLPLQQHNEQPPLQQHNKQPPLQQHNKQPPLQQHNEQPQLGNLENNINVSQPSNIINIF